MQRTEKGERLTIMKIFLADLRAGVYCLTLCKGYSNEESERTNNGLTPRPGEVVYQ